MALLTVFAKNMLHRRPMRTLPIYPLPITDKYFKYKINYKSKYDNALLKWNKIPSSNKIIQ